MEPAQPSQPDTATTGAPANPVVTAEVTPVSGEPSVGSPSLVDRAKGTLGNLFGPGSDAVEPAAGTTDQATAAAATTAQSGIDASTIAAVPPPVEATWQTDSGQVPGLQPRGYEPAAAAVSEEPIAAWAAPTEPGNPVVADSSTGTPDATPPVSPVWPTTPDAAAPVQTVSDPTPAAEADMSSASSPSVEPVGVNAGGTDQTAPNEPPTSERAEKPESMTQEAWQRMNLVWGAIEGLTGSSSRRASEAAQGDPQLEAIFRMTEGILNAGERAGIPSDKIQSTVEGVFKDTNSTQPQNQVPAAPAAEDPMASTASDALRGNTTGQTAPGIPGSGSSSFS